MLFDCAAGQASVLPIFWLADDVHQADAFAFALNSCRFFSRATSPRLPPHLKPGRRKPPQEAACGVWL
jgi:hypothetical protein